MVSQMECWNSDTYKIKEVFRVASLITPTLDNPVQKETGETGIVLNTLQCFSISDEANILERKEPILAVDPLSKRIVQLDLETDLDISKYPDASITAEGFYLVMVGDMKGWLSRAWMKKITE